MPIAKAKEPHPGTLNRGRIIGSSNIPVARTNPVLLKSSEATKKGNSDGNTISSHNFMPLSAELTAVLEKIIKQNMKVMLTAGRTSFLSLIILIDFNL